MTTLTTCKRVKLAASIMLSICLCTATPAGAEGRWPGLQSYFDTLQSFRADFTQEIRRADSASDMSTGSVVLKKPNLFRWDYQQPYRQLVLGDGERLWHYDPDLEQATVQRLDDALAQSPLTQLMSGAPIEEIFTVEVFKSASSEMRYRLTPVGTENDFGAVEIRFIAGELSSLELEDALGQTTRVEFSNTIRDEPIPAETWKFAPPPGTDIVGDG